MFVFMKVKIKDWILVTTSAAAVPNKALLLILSAYWNRTNIVSNYSVCASRPSSPSSSSFRWSTDVLPGDDDVKWIA
jgi:hypothetical protein